MGNQQIPDNEDVISPRPTTFIIHWEESTRVVQGTDHETVEAILERAETDLAPSVNAFLGECVAALREGEEVEDGEDDHEPVAGHATAHHCRAAGSVVHIHCHRCRRVKTSVSYNGRDKHHRFSPSATVETARRWAVNKFKIPATDGERLFLWLLGSEQPLDGTKHMGDLAQAPHCQLALLLLPDPRVQG